jgi:molybdate transport system ATP-binding protein
MIELDVHVPLTDFALKVRATLEARAIAIVGPSGSGKTTLLESIAGLRPGTRGRIVIDGTTLLDERIDLPPNERRVGWVPQEVALFPHLDVAANIAFGARGRIDDAIDVLELRPLLQRRPATLSGGERQRVALARALATEPRILLLDEPLAAVDVAHRARILPWLLKVRDASNVPMLHVTHDLGEAAALSTHAIVLRGGAVAAIGTVADAIGAAPELALDNLLVGEVTAPGLLTIGAASLAVPRGDALGAAVYAIAASEIIIATERPRAISARNVIEATIARVSVTGDDAIVEVNALGSTLRAKLTDVAVEGLSLAAGGRAFLIIKTHALRRLGEPAR